MNPMKVMNNAKVMFVRALLNLNKNLRNVLLTDRKTCADVWNLNNGPV